MNDAKTKAVKKVYHQLMSRSYVPYTVEEALQDVWDAAMKEVEKRIMNSSQMKEYGAVDDDDIKLTFKSLRGKE